MFAVALAIADYTGLRYNPTESFPWGVYQRGSKAPERGDLVIFDPPQGPVLDMALARGYIGRGVFTRYETMLKRLVALGGDVISITPEGVSVNGRQLVNSIPLASDVAGRAMPVWRVENYRLKADEVLLMSDYSPFSFDGRYFGPIPRGCIQSVVRPVWTW